MTWIALGVLSFAVGVLLLWAGKPGGPWHAPNAQYGLPSEAYAFACLLSTVLGMGMVIKGFISLLS